MFVDSMEWVMIPNVYGVSQFADGGTLATKPYFSSSTYLLKREIIKRKWVEIWDSLFWNFIDK
jgi:deoxyribodipyrimidine photolyase-related protein